MVSSTWILVLLPLDLLIGMALGWYLRGFRIHAGERNEDSSVGAPADQAERDHCIVILGEIRNCVLTHANAMKSFLDSVQTCGPNPADVSRISDINAAFDQEFSDQIDQLQEIDQSALTDSHLDTRLDEHRRLVQRLSQSLAAIPEASTLKSVSDLVVEPITALLESQTVLQTVLQQTRHRITEQESLLKRARTEARRDPLTRLPNRRAFDEEFAKLDRIFIPGRTAASLIIADVDHFKDFNDTYGHAAGDAVLSVIGRILPSVLRSGDMAFRIGGEEFAIVLKDTSDVQARHIAGRLCERIAAAIVRFDGKLLQVTMSCGVASFVPGMDQEQLLRNADTALYDAKRSGRNRVCSFSGTADEPAVRAARGDRDEDLLSPTEHDNPTQSKSHPLFIPSAG